MNCDNFIVNNGFISSTHEQTKLNAFDHLISFDKPIYRIPVHVFLAACTCAWRNDKSSIVPVPMRKITCGIALGVLAISGLIDATLRVAAAILLPIITQSLNPSKACLSDAFFGLAQSFHFLTSLQISNLFKEDSMPYIISS